jgi:hypothetical protein
MPLLAITAIIKSGIKNGTANQNHYNHAADFRYRRGIVGALQ